MRIAIVGAGGIGGYLAARLTAAGTEVALLARGSQLAAIRAGGLRLIDPDGDLTVTPAILTDDAGALGTPDLIILAVKAHQLAGAIAQIRPATGPETRLLPFQNGVDAPDMLADAFGDTRALIGVARILVNITAPGTLTRYGAPKTFTIGTRDGRQDGARDMIDTFRAAGIDAPDNGDVRRDLWTKFVFFNGLSSITAGTRKRMGDIREGPAALDLMERLMREAQAVAEASGVPLPEDLVDQTMARVIPAMPADARASTAHDLDEGRPLEIDFICGAVARRGRALGIDVTASETVYALLAPWKDGTPA